MSNCKELKFVYMDYLSVDIVLKQRKTVLNGDSATGKSYLYNVIAQYAQEEKRSDILCINVDNFDAEDVDYTIEKIKRLKNGIVVIDQADDILSNEKLYEYIFLDQKNFYIIMSRKYYEKYSELARTKISKNNISIQYKLNAV